MVPAAAPVLEGRHVSGLGQSLLVGYGAFAAPFALAFYVTHRRLPRDRWR